MGKSGDEDDIVQLPAAWTIQHKRLRAELDLGAIWDAHERPYAQAIGGHTGWLDHAKKGGWAVENWVVEGLFMKGHIGLLVGDAGTGKSLSMLDLMLAMVSGGKWLGHFECLTSPVVYLAGEGKLDENTSHIIGLALGRGENLEEFFARCGHRIQLHAPTAVGMSAAAPLSSDEWWKNIHHLVESTLPREARPKLWVLDPLMALVNSTDKADDVRPLIARIRWLAESTDGYVLTGHHTKKDQLGQLSRTAKIRGESMLRNLFDDVLYLENDAEDSRLTHLYANKLKRGVSDDTKPLCHIMRVFNPIDKATFDNAMRVMGVQRTGEESPRALHQIVVRYLPYSAELHREHEDTSGDVEAPVARAAKAEQVASRPRAEEPDTTTWDRDHHRVYAALRASDKPLSIGALAQALESDGGASISRTKVQARIDGLVAQRIVVSVMVEREGPGRPGTSYTLASRI